MLSDFVSLFFPRYCVGCNAALTKGEELICITCQFEIPKTNSHVDKPNFVENKFYGKVQLAYALAFYKFERKGRLQQILHHLKYGNKPEIGDLIGEWYGNELKKNTLSENFDVIVPVPLHRTKLRRRGYNQSAQFGEGLSKALGIPLKPNALKRIKKTPTQTRKSRLQRWKNVDRIFEVADHQSIKDQRVLLIDDVITTGSTLESCIVSILYANPAEVSVAAIAAAK